MSGKSNTPRQLKVSESLKRTISDALNLQQVLAHVLGDLHITVSEVRVSPDLKNAKIYVLPDCSKEDLAQVLKLLNEFSYEVKKIIARQNALKYIPQLKFYYDDSFDQAQHIANLLTGLKPNPAQSDE